MRIPRFIGKVTEESQLLIFCDASIKAYTTTLYLRVNDGTKFQVNLLFSKMRLVPIAKKRKMKDVTIPRLELLAVLIGVRDANFLVRELEMSGFCGPIHNVFYIGSKQENLYQCLLKIVLRRS